MPLTDGHAVVLPPRFVGSLCIFAIADVNNLASPIQLQKNNVAHRLLRIILELKFSLEDAAAALREDLNQNPTLACNELSSWPSNPGLKRVNAKADLPVKLNPMTILVDYEIPVENFSGGLLEAIRKV
ncbi:hypothetical protein FB451DRAFT_1190550 [Mycena latifolia]|nr:hypothetical protein FB451DRAFT_1190550 [Mycena latifolia]